MDVTEIPEPERAIWQAFHRPVDENEGGTRAMRDPDGALRRFIAARDRVEALARQDGGLVQDAERLELLAEAVVAASDLIEHLAHGGWPPDWPSHMDLKKSAPPHQANR